MAFADVQRLMKRDGRERHADSIEAKDRGLSDQMCRGGRSVSIMAWQGQGSEAGKPQDIRDMFGASVDFVGDSRVVFDIGGNRFRMVVRVAYGPCYRVMIKFIGTHAEYDRIDVERI